MNSSVFNPDMLILARESRGITQTELAERVGVTQGKISKFESGMLAVSTEEAARIARSLDYPSSFFYQPDKLAGCGSICDYYRKRKSLPHMELKRLQARANLMRLYTKALLYRAELDTPLKFHRMDIADYEAGSTQIAQLLRNSWNVAMGPVRNLIGTIEDAGGIVFKMDFGTPQIDAISNWPKGMPPLFYVNASNPPDRMRFTLCHEIGHLVMHYVPTNDMEGEADRFAAEFLMPAAEISSQLHELTLPKLAALKEYWRVSMAALIRRAHDLGRIDDRRYRNLFTEMSRRGYRLQEPGEVPAEEPTVFRELIQIHRSYHGYSVAELCILLHTKERYFLSDCLGETQSHADPPHMRLAN